MRNSTRSRILRYLRERKTVTGTDLASQLGISRQAVNKHLKALVREGEVVKRGVTRGATYALAGRGDAWQSHQSIRRRFGSRGLEEDRVFRDLSNLLSLERALSPRAMAILRYGFTEILNNAIDHSKSSHCTVELTVGQYDCGFMVRDFGIGIFHSIQSKFGLPDEEAALGQLLKGKTTTIPERHTGEGIFFTSKAADQLAIRSHRALLRFDNPHKDVSVGVMRQLKGTEVRFSISRSSRKDLSAIFRAHSPEEYDYQFQKTEVLVRLHLKEYVSRSEAKRLLSGLEKFREVILDFGGVKQIGQGFADELFRVFPLDHPSVKIRVEKMNPTLSQMVRHVVDNQRSSKVDK
jgi:biotin operon repressor/anti-sigma regulatory factor (Ser/Thr protein kinase)